MPLEIERRFLVREGHGVWSTDSVRIVQGYIPLPQGWNQRVRIIGDDAEPTEERPVAPGVREEFTRPIAVLDALDLLFSHCAGRIVEKVRHLVPAGGRTWKVDVFLGANRGLVTAEVELDHAHEDIDLPPWIGREVTSDPRYGNSSLARAPFSTWVSAAAA